MLRLELVTSEQPPSLRVALALQRYPPTTSFRYDGASPATSPPTTTLTRARHGTNSDSCALATCWLQHRSPSRAILSRHPQLLFSHRADHLPAATAHSSAAYRRPRHKRSALPSRGLHARSPTARHQFRPETTLDPEADEPRARSRPPRRLLLLFSSPRSVRHDELCYETLLFLLRPSPSPSPAPRRPLRVPLRPVLWRRPDPVCFCSNHGFRSQDQGQEPRR